MEAPDPDAYENPAAVALGAIPILTTTFNIFILVFSLFCIAGALFGRGERGTISSRVRRTMLVLAGLIGIFSVILRLGWLKL
jgi:hypothetical protein